jgi:hypothetical protein
MDQIYAARTQRLKQVYYEFHKRGITKEQVRNVIRKA